MVKKGKSYGYARVSTNRQFEDRQISALENLNVPLENIFVDKQSGKDFCRSQYRALLSRLRKKDVLYVKSIDRLGRNYREILEQWEYLTKKIGAHVAIIDMPLLDTRRGGDLMNNFISDVVLQILSFVAENERTNILLRQREGIVAAKARGVRFGRPPAKVPDNFYAVVAIWQAGFLTGTAAAKECLMAPSTFRYRAKKYLEQEAERKRELVREKIRSRKMTVVDKKTS
ncbi:MAG: recombinase family protein [Thermoguttaceae bacterium]|nr:recombinase family protein [Thermoguttaceae bacterium]